MPGEAVDVVHAHHVALALVATRLGRGLGRTDLAVAVRGIERPAYPTQDAPGGGADPGAGGGMAGGRADDGAEGGAGGRPAQGAGPGGPGRIIVAAIGDTACQRHGKENYDCNRQPFPSHLVPSLPQCGSGQNANALVPGNIRHNHWFSHHIIKL